MNQSENTSLPPLRGQVLMIDADDTLWENNIYFERAIEQFVDIVAHPERSPAEVREAFDALEADRVKTHGYGTDAFHQSLRAGYVHLTGLDCDAKTEALLHACAQSIRRAEMEVLEGVAETLAVLRMHHRVLLVTKGAQDEQQEKLQRSGLADHFHHVEVLREKRPQAYLNLLERYGCNPSKTWMIGNSPRSDINPALAAGMHAVYLPHPSTWVLEQEAVAEPREGQQLLHLRRFSELLHHFG